MTDDKEVAEFPTGVPKFVTYSVFTCAACGAMKRVGDEPGDLIEGWYLKVARVYANDEIGITDEVFTCDKECAIAYLQFKVGNQLIANRHER